MSKKPPSKFSLSAEDKDIWASYTKDMKPLRRQSRKAALSPKKPEPIFMAQKKAIAPAAVLTLEAKKAPSPSATSTLDRRTEARLKRGQLPIQGRLDLHGLTQTKAHGALTAFIQQHHDKGSRCVLIITGKGSGQGTGILRQMVPRWLGEPHLQPHILSVTSAQPQHGGDGALYILLRRQR